MTSSSVKIPCSGPLLSSKVSYISECCHLEVFSGVAIDVLQKKKKRGKNKVCLSCVFELLVEGGRTSIREHCVLTTIDLKLRVHYPGLP